MRVLSLLLGAAAAAKIGQDLPRPARHSPTSDPIVEAQVVTARVGEPSEVFNISLEAANASFLGNQTASQRLLSDTRSAVLRAAEWVRTTNPSLYLILASAMVGGSQNHKRQEVQHRLEVAMAQRDEAQATRLAAEASYAAASERVASLEAELERVGERLEDRVQLDENAHIAIVTTAALPWMTGTAVNPLLRAAHLARAGRQVSLMVPWLHPIEQALIFPKGISFATPADQEAFMHEWLVERAAVTAGFKILFYPGRYDQERGSILPLGDITRFFSADESEVCVLEEPEHLTWYHNGPNWRHRFKLVVGVVHTNYLYYAQTWASGKLSHGGKLAAMTLEHINCAMCRAYCDLVIKLSDTLQPLPRSVVSNVHGVRSDFLRIGERRRRFRKGAYFLGKVLWAKGHRLLIDYLALEKEGLGGKGGRSHVDVFGSGEDLAAVREEAARLGVDVCFLPPTDHAGPQVRDYKVFVNPSQSEVLSTTTLEALAMGKFVVIEDHPSNAFFMQFANTLSYSSPLQFLQQLHRALSSHPAPLTAAERRALSWEGATERFLDCLKKATVGETLPSFADHTANWMHQLPQKGGLIGDALRLVSGAGPIAKQSWLTAQRFRDAQVSDIVEQSIRLSPPVLPQRED